MWVELSRYAFGRLVGVSLGGRGLRWSATCGWWLVPAGDVADRDGFVAVWAEPAEVDADAGVVAVVAPLLAEGAGVAGGALIDGDVAAGGAGWDHDDRLGGRVGVAWAPGGLAAGGGGVA